MEPKPTNLRTLPPMVVDVGDAIAVRSSLLTLGVTIDGRYFDVPYDVIDGSSEVQTIGDCGTLRVKRWWASQEKLI